jgi:hypothetical protein
VALNRRGRATISAGKIGQRKHKRGIQSFPCDV